jgi:predicted dehydrogenase
MQTGIAFVGCGYVADYYASALAAHPELKLLGVHDRDSERSDRFSARYAVRAHSSLEALLADPKVEIVVNLTPAFAHYEVSMLALEAGKHVYSEKPLTVCDDDSARLVDTAKRMGCQLSGAPCCVLGESAQTIWRAIRDGAIGTVRVAYAEVDVGPVHLMPHGRWRSASGAPWPFREESRLGCVRGHGSYPVAWLAAMFGPVREVTSFTSRRPEQPSEDFERGPELGVACLTFDGGVVARVTAGLLARRDRSIRIFGDGGMLATADCSNDRSPVVWRRYMSVRRRLLFGPWPRRRPLLRSGLRAVRYRGAQRRDFASGIADLAGAIREGRSPRLSAEFCRHTTEVVLAMHDSGPGQPARRAIRSSFSRLAPMPWAV